MAENQHFYPFIEWDITAYQSHEQLQRIRQIQNSFNNNTFHIQNSYPIPGYRILYDYIVKKRNGPIEEIVNECVNRMWMEIHTPYTTCNQKAFNERGINRLHSIRNSTAKAREVLSIIDWLNNLNNNQGIDISNYRQVMFPPPNSLWDLIDLIINEIREERLSLQI
ncbi:hypothetical protein BJ944DRAFT_241682 [Cunninghamella echinulata]|nr:hypothetical protein BJ944DRAFT_241682 [Cunninghamella echinulata]